MNSAISKKKPAAYGRGTLNHSAVLETAAAMFNELGFDRTSMNSIAEKLGVTKPSLYHYYPSKDAILIACFKEAGVTFERRMLVVLQEDVTAYEQLLGVLRLYVKAMEWDVFRALVLADERTLSKAGSNHVNKAKRRINTAVEKLITEAVADGDLKVDNPRLASFAVFGIYNWMAVWRTKDWSSNGDEIEQAFENFILAGLGARPTKRRRRKKTGA